MMPAPVTDPTILLARALRVSARAAGVAVAIVATGETPWASAAFVGTRHRVDLAIASGAARDAWLVALRQAELALRGHLVADLTIAAVDRDVVALDILTIVMPADD